MAAAVVGTPTASPPGYLLSLSWWKLELWSEGEYVFDSHEEADSFFYQLVRAERLGRWTGSASE